MGHVFDWGHELYEEYLPGMRPGRPLPARLPVPAARWRRMALATMHVAGAHGLWFSGFVALPFDVLRFPSPSHAWRTPAAFAAEYRRTGLRWDLDVEARAARLALARGWASVIRPAERAPTRRLSLVDPGYRRAALAEIRRIVPPYRRVSYVAAATGSDEPLLLPPAGPGRRTPFGRSLQRALARALPRAAASRPEGLRVLAWSRLGERRFLALKRAEATLIHRLDPPVRVIPNDFAFVDGFEPWDYSRFGAVADEVEADPYVTYLEREEPGRGRENPGFAAKLLSDLTGRPVRIIVQAFPYAGRRVTSRQVARWAAQALGAGGSDLSFYSEGDPRVSDPALYREILGLAARLRGSVLPPAPEDRSTLLLYATASEGQGQPGRAGPVRYLTRADALYTTYAALGPLGHAAFVFDSDRRVEADPARLRGVRTIWLPRADVLGPALVRELIGWVRGGGALIVTDPGAFGRSPEGMPLRRLAAPLLAPLRRAPAAPALALSGGALAPGRPGRPLRLPIPGRARLAFARVPAGARVVARLRGRPAALLRRVGAGWVLQLADDPMRPATLLRPAPLVAFVTAVQRWRRGSFSERSWDYAIPPRPSR
jgi:hypothetical protein